MPLTTPKIMLRCTMPLLLALALIPPTTLAPAAYGADKDPDKATTASAATDALQQTPEGALRAFLASMLGPDAATLRQVILPVSNADFAMLLASKPVSTEVRQIEVGRIASMPLRALKVGDTVPLPGGRSLTVGKGDVGHDTTLLQMSSNPLPVLVHRVKGRWYVDAAPMIAARKTAAALQQKLPKQAAAKHATHPKAMPKH